MREEETGTIEVRGEDVEAAIAAGLRQLGLGPDDVIVEIVDEGRRGFLGLGGREAIVRLAPIKRAPALAKPVTPVPTMHEPVGAGPETRRPTPPASEQVAQTQPSTDVAREGPSVEAELDEQELVVFEIVQGLLQHLQIEAALSARRTEPDDLTGKRLLVLDVQGDDLGELIGPRGEVLSDFQYVARLMAGHRLHQRADFLVDVDGYRQRRQKALSKLARRMASKAVKSGRPVTLEPMSPYDRRIIHLTLRGDDAVYTESTGQGNRRRVRIFPK